MGYTHYWYTPKTLGTPQQFKNFAKDVKKIIDYCNDELGIAIAGGDGEGKPIITGKEIVFNGSTEQPAGAWTTQEEISIPWPSKKAGLAEVKEGQFDKKTSGNWFAGTIVSQRCAPISNLTGKGSGDYETFYIQNTTTDKQDWREEKDENRAVFGFCKTAYRPYDLTVTAVLIALKHHFPACTISTDGEEKDWLDGRFLCNNLLGYGMEAEIG